MKNTIFIKENFIKALTSSVCTVEETQNVYKNNVSQGILYNLINRKEYLKETCEALNSEEQKMIFISGFQGTGKTEFINTLISGLEENVFNFYYECSSVTHFDDIILSFFNYLKKITNKNPEYKRTFKISNSHSIDERLINYIKSLNLPLLIIIDGFENFTEEQKELIQFLEFVSKLPEVKIILSGRKINFSELIKHEDFFEIRLSALEEAEAFKILKDKGIIENESALQQIFQVTRGYPEKLLWFSNAVNALEINSFDLMKDYYSKEQKSFEGFVYEKIYKSFPDEIFKIICFFATIRHPVEIKTLDSLNFTSDILEKIDYLKSKMVLTQNREVFYIKDELKTVIYSNISLEEKKQIHRYLYELYSDQISKKLEERVFSISRKLLYSEQYYHYMCLINCGDKSLPDIKTTALSNLKPDFKYLYANITDSLFVGSKDPSLQEEASVKTEPLQETKIIEFEKEKYSGFDVETDFKIELSEEEKQLLSQENDLNQTGETINDFIFVNEPEEEKLLMQDESLKTENISSVNSAFSPIERKIENLKNLATDFYEQGKLDEAAKKFEEVLVLYQIIKHDENINSTLLSIANIYSEAFRHDAALMYYYRILNSENQNKDTEITIEALCGIADIYDYRENFENALNLYQRALEEAKKSDNLKQKAKIYFKNALVYDDMGNFDKALEFYLKSIDASQDIETNPNISAAYANMAIIYGEREDLNNSKKYYLESLKFDKLTNNKEGQFETLSSIGNIYFEMFNYQKANDCFHEALKIARELEDSYKIAMSYLDIGDIYFQQKNYEKALKSFIIASKIIDKTISTDSREKIDRRIKHLMGEIGEHNFKQIIEKIKKKHG